MASKFIDDSDAELDDSFEFRKTSESPKNRKKLPVKTKPKKLKLQTHLLHLEKEYGDGVVTDIQNCIRIKKANGTGSFIIKVPAKTRGTEYLVIQKYSTADMEKAESKERWKTCTFNARCVFNEENKSDEAIISTFNTLQDLMMDRFMGDPDKSIDTYKS